MYGFVRPLKCEMKVREFELFQSEYCGLCHALKSRYGFFARFLVSYDLTFLAMLIDTTEKSLPSFEKKRCAASIFRKKCVCTGSGALCRAAGLCVILAYWKLRDDVSDCGLFRSLPARAACALLKRAYSRAAGDFPLFDSEVRRSLSELDDLEKSGCASLDAPADTFGRILACGAKLAEDGGLARAAGEILYHVGRWIYIMDAVFDLKKDIESGAYNVLSRRFSPEAGRLSENERKELEATASCSVRAAQLAFELLPKAPAGEIVENILYLGLPFTQENVLNERWAGRKL